MAAGIVFSLLAAITLNTGNLVQKHAVSSLPDFSARRSGHLVRTLASSREWMAGFILCLVGVALEVVAFGLAPIAVVQAMLNSGVVLLIVVSRLRLGERLHRNEWIGLAIVVASLISLSASLAEPRNSIGLADSGLPVLLAAAPTLVVVALIVAAIRSGRSKGSFLYGTAAGLLYGAAALGTKGASTLVVRHGVVASVPIHFDIGVSLRLSVLLCTWDAHLSDRVATLPHLRGRVDVGRREQYISCRRRHGGLRRASTSGPDDPCSFAW